MKDVQCLQHVGVLPNGGAFELRRRRGAGVSPVVAEALDGRCGWAVEGGSGAIRRLVMLVVVDVLHHLQLAGDDDKHRHAVLALLTQRRATRVPLAPHQRRQPAQLPWQQAAEDGGVRDHLDNGPKNGYKGWGRGWG